MEQTPKNNLKNDYVYKTVGNDKLELTFLPPINDVYEKAPVYFIITGGGWQTSVRKSIIDFSEASVTALREKGFAVVSPDYRTSQVGAKLSNIIADCFSALKFIIDYADALKIDIEKIVTSGHSAGAYLALMLAYADSEKFGVVCGNYNIIASAALSPATVLHTDGYAKTVLFEIDHLFANADSLSERKLVSPIEYVCKGSAPTVTVAGTADNIIDCESSKLLYDALIKNGVKSELILSENGGHCYEKVNDNEPSVNMLEVQSKITDFILSCM